MKTEEWWQKLWGMLPEAWMKVLRRESANLICWFRILGSCVVLGLAMSKMRPNVWVAIFYSMLLVSDLLDGFCYRAFVAADPPRHWFNWLPVTLDPLADLVFTLAGVAFWRLKMGATIWMVAVDWLAIAALALALSVAIAMLRGRLRSVATVLLVYGCFALMIVNVCVIWKLSEWKHWAIGLMASIVIFYEVFWRIVPQERWWRC